MKLLTASLTGKALSWALAKALNARNVWIRDGAAFCRDGLEVCATIGNDVYEPFDHADPALWASLVEKNRLRLTPSRMSTNEWYCDRLKDQASIYAVGTTQAVGTTPAEAVARCVVAMRLGDEVDVPDQLCEEHP